MIILESAENSLEEKVRFIFCRNIHCLYIKFYRIFYKKHFQQDKDPKKGKFKEKIDI